MRSIRFSGFGPFVSFTLESNESNLYNLAQLKQLFVLNNSRYKMASFVSSLSPDYQFGLADPLILANKLIYPFIWNNGPI